jgi:hypothetical protein
MQKRARELCVFFKSLSDSANFVILSVAKRNEESELSSIPKSQILRGVYTE